ncbi:MAG TPA: anaerobic ribonucleoside-triphosphate reductase activating protein [Desulfobacterales bacterium]|nr:anaerobic ribonucleoside-triphosphate reductase activating protein [Desulfobacterales bacterium]
MKIGALQKFSMIDYPGKVCAIVFTIGCNFRCGYCHNPELVHPEQFPKPIPQKEIFEFLKKRKGKLEAVTITGGEPTLQPDLILFLEQIKRHDYLVKLDTNGTNPDMLQQTIKNKLVDYIAMDIKGPLSRYQEIVNITLNINKIEKSISLIMNSEIEYEFRTTITKHQISAKDIIEIGKRIHGAKLYALQKFIPTKTNDPAFLNAQTYTDQEFMLLQEIANKYVQKCITR